MRNLPSQAFEKFPLVWGSPPAGGVGGPGDSAIAPPPNGNSPAGGGIGGLSTALASVTFTFDDAGTVNTAFPTAVRVAQQGFVTPIGLAFVDIVSSVVNATSNGIVAVIVAKDVGASINISQNTNILAIHLVTQGLSHSMRSGTAFSEDVAPRFGSNENVALYVAASGTGFASNRITAAITLRYFSQI